MSELNGVFWAAVSPVLLRLSPARPSEEACVVCLSVCPILMAGDFSA